MSDTYASHASGLDSPGAHAFAVTPDDEADLPFVTRAFMSAARARCM